MVYTLTDPEKVRPLFGSWEETMIISCLQRVMGTLYVTDTGHPKSVMAVLGDFAFFAGRPCRELAESKRPGFLIMVPQNEAWAHMIEACFPGRCRRVTRYAIRKDTVFDRDRLRSLKSRLPEGCLLQRIDSTLYDQCMENAWSRDLVSVFPSREAFLRDGLGMAVTVNGRIVSGASSYTRYREGIEVEVDTRRDYRRRSLATVCSAALILSCLDLGLYPSWDAQNLWSVCLAEKLGYTFSHEYPVYEVE